MWKHELPDAINWAAILAAPKYAGGHNAVMEAIFEGHARVIASWVDSGYGGEEAFAYQFPDNSVAILTDYFGSCSGCDMWDDSPAEADIRAAIGSLVNSARVFATSSDAVIWLQVMGEDFNDGDDFSMRAAVHLIPRLEGHVADIETA